MTPAGKAVLEYRGDAAKVFDTLNALPTLIATLRARIAELEAALVEAREMVEQWGAYADELPIDAAGDEAEEVGRAGRRRFLPDPRAHQDGPRGVRAPDGRDGRGG